MSTGASPRGRPAATTHDRIEREAFELFAEHGFEATTLDMIAERIGVSRRTVTRYYPSKNDIAWGEFDQTLSGFRAQLEHTSPGLPLWQRVHDAVMEFNAFPDQAVPSHRERVALILRTPGLLAHSMIRYDAWRAVITQFVAEQTGQRVTDALPQLAGYVSLALSMSAYETWLDQSADSQIHPAEGSGDFLSTLDATMQGLRQYLSQPC